MALKIKLLTQQIVIDNKISYEKAEFSGEESLWKEFLFII